MASGIPRDSSQMFAKNIFNLLSPFIKDGSYEPDFEDEVIKNCLIVKDGSICNDSIKNIMEDK
jgi:NAD(P) transhydrogenase subunit alpha